MSKTKTTTTATTSKKAKLRKATEQVSRIREAMNSGEFSIGKLAKELKWPFQKVRHHVLSIAKKENKKLTSVSRGIWTAN